MTSLAIILLIFTLIAVIGGAILLSTQKVDADHAATEAKRAVATMQGTIPQFEASRAASERALDAMIDAGNKQATAARRGNLREVERGMRPLTVREIAIYAKNLPPPEHASEMNYTMMARTEPPLVYPLAPIADRAVYRRLYFRKELLRVVEDTRGNDQRSARSPYYRPPDWRDYREQTVWVYDGVVVLTPLTIEEEYTDRKDDWHFGADVRPYLVRRFGGMIDQLDDRTIEDAFSVGLMERQKYGALPWR